MLKEISRTDGKMREKNIVHCLGCQELIRLDWNEGGLDSWDCCGYHYRLEYTGVDIVISKDIPDKFPGVIFVRCGSKVTYLEIFCDEECLMSNSDGHAEFSADIDISYDKVPHTARCGGCGKVLKN